VNLEVDSITLYRNLETYICSLTARPTIAFHEAALAFVARELRARRWVERSGGSLAYVDRLLDCWPSARFVHLYRNGVECAYSMSKHPYFRIRVARAMCDANLTVAECLRMSIPIDRFGAYWSSVLVNGFAHLRTRSGSDVIHVDFAELLRAPTQVLTRIESFVGTPAPTPWLEQATYLIRPVASSADAIPSNQRVLLERTCRPGARVVQRLEAAARKSSLDRGEKAAT
jgi:hypothetical protein